MNARRSDTEPDPATAPTALSVIIPCHNAAPYLAQTLGSLLEQTRPPEEIIIIDDASTDGSAAMARRFEAAAGGRIRVYSGRFGNAPRARSAGADIARGSLIMFLDADDVLDPDALAGLSAALATEPVGVATCRWERLELHENAWVRRPPSCRPWSARHDALGNWLRGWYHPTSTMLWTREAFAATGGWDPAAEVNNDGDLMMRALIEDIPLVRTDRGACLYRRLPADQASVSSGRRTRRGLASRLRVLEKIAVRLQQRGRLEQYRAPLREALGQLWADAAGHEDVRRRIEACRSACGLTLRRPGSPGGQTLQRLGGALRMAGAGGPVGRQEGEHIRYGLDAAETAARASAPAEGAGASPLPPRPAVSVIIPTYNRAATLERAIQSVLGQTCPDIELLVVDDGSTDETEALLGQISDPRLRVLRQPENRGVGAARNRGLRAARGEFIAFLDSDDEWAPSKLERQLKRFAQLPDDVGLIYTGVETIAADGARSIQQPEARGSIYRQMLVRNRIHGGGSNAMIRRSIIPTIGFFDEQLPAIEDYDYWLRLSRFYRVDYVPEALLRYHTPPAQRKSLARADNLQAREELFRRYAGEMRRLGAAHLYLLDSAGRHLGGARPDRRSARRLALQAARQRPLSRASLYALLYTLAPADLLGRVRDRRRARAAGARPSSTAASTPDTLDRPPRPLRILLLSGVPRTPAGGVAGAQAQLAEGLRARGHTVSAAWGRAPGEPAREDELPLAEIRLWRGLPAPRSAAQSARFILQLARLLRRERPAIVNLHFIHARTAQILVWLRPLLRYRLVLSAHGSDLLALPPGAERWLPRVLPRADAIVAVTPALAARLRGFAGVDPARVAVIPNGVDCAFWAADPEAPPVPGPPTVITVGQLRHIKGQDILLEAWPRVLQARPEARLRIVGEGESRAELEARAGELGIAGSVTFAGQFPPEQVRAALRQASLFALPSRSEALPIALLEAMACGKPVVATDVGGVGDLLAGGAGALVPPEDAESLAREILAVLGDPARAERLAAAGRLRAGEHAEGAMVDAYERLFAGLMM